LENFAGQVKRHQAGIFYGYPPLTAWFSAALIEDNTHIWRFIVNNKNNQ
jgi:hypothetical protein